MVFLDLRLVKVQSVAAVYPSHSLLFSQPEKAAPALGECRRDKKLPRNLGGGQERPPGIQALIRVLMDKTFWRVAMVTLPFNSRIPAWQLLSKWNKVVRKGIAKIGCY